MINKYCVGELNVGRLYAGVSIDYRLYKLGVISQEWLKIEVKLLLC